ncbi:MAG: SMP-30/gluconolactonase/LRE family protein [Fermentimonas sp.]|nr:SMP-30/gluconolactonase/LRE family protein [Fermentimonas sp.]MDD4695900.1 SMP-30/gluconolactonase/LRE family protein [Fermentimonas sp.]
MNRRIFFICFSLATITMAFNLHGQQVSLIAENAAIHKSGTGYTFTEGPAVAADGKVYFTDQPNDRIYVWDENDGISLWLEGTERSNGMYFNNKNQLVACADLHNRLITIDEDKNINVLFENYEGKHLNGPNDLWISPDDRIYFTDPYYHRNYWAKEHSEAQDTRGVYFLSHDGSVARVVDDYVQPNGLIGTADGKILYIADINDRKIWKYNIEPDGKLSNKTFFAPEGSDGMTIDDKGNIYLTMGKLWIYSPEGKLIQEIEFPESPSNVCFGGINRDILFVTARSSVYTLKMNVKGVK